MEPSAIIVIAIACIVVSLITYHLTKSMLYKSIKIEFDLELEKIKNSLRIDAVENYKLDDGYNSTLGNEYLRGKNDGAKEELEKIAITYQPYHEIYEEYLGIKKTVEIGYKMQLLYNGLPVGDLTTRILNKLVKYDKKTIEKIVNSEIMKALSNLTSMAAERGIKAKIISEHKR